jgi:hypothetical protein
MECGVGIIAVSGNVRHAYHTACGNVGVSMLMSIAILMFNVNGDVEV